METRARFIKGIGDNQAAFGLALEDRVIERLADHFDLVTQHNPLLHLTGPSTPEAFAVRHVLESLTMLEFLPQGATFADVGSGAGFPAIPCLIAREDLRATLIESKEKKASFLLAATEELGLAERVSVINKQFAEMKLDDDIKFVCCRAIERFADILPRLVKWAGERKPLFFGGPTLAAALTKLRVQHDAKLLPMSDQRFLFVCK